MLANILEFDSVDALLKLRAEFFTPEVSSRFFPSRTERWITTSEWGRIRFQHFLTCLATHRTIFKRYVLFLCRVIFTHRICSTTTLSKGRRTAATPAVPGLQQDAAVQRLIQYRFRRHTQNCFHRPLLRYWEKVHLTHPTASLAWSTAATSFRAGLRLGRVVGSNNQTTTSVTGAAAV